MSDLSQRQVVIADMVAGSKVSSEEERHNHVRELVDSLLRAVSEQDRILLMLKEMEGLSYKELEKIYSVNANALRQRLVHSRRRMLNAFEATLDPKSS